MNEIAFNRRNLLDWASKILKTDIRYLLRGGSWLGIGQIITTAAGFILSVIFANLLPPDTYGSYKYILSIGTIFTMFTLTGMDPAMTRAVARGLEGSFIPGLKTKLRWSTLGVIAGGVGALYYYQNGNYTLAIAMIIVGCGVPLMETFDLYNSVLNGRKLFRTFTYYNVATQISLSIILGILLVFNKNVLVIVGVYFLLNILLNLLFLFLTLKHTDLGTRSDPEVDRYAKHLSLIDIISILLGQLDKVLVFHYLGAANLAIYALAVAPTDQIKGVFKNLNFLALPKFTSRSAAEIKAGLFKKVVFLTLSIVVTVACYVVAAPFLFKIFFPQYMDAIPYTQIMAISIIGAIVGTFLYTILESKGATKSLYRYNIWTNLVGLVLLFPLISLFGIWGAIVARLFTRFFASTLAYVLVMKMPEEQRR